MKKRRYRVIAFWITCSILLNSIPLPTQAANPGSPAYVNTYVNTGNQRADIIGVALTQLGYMEKESRDYENDTKYGDWCGYPYQPWCAAFVSWCARQAEISTDILARTARAHPDYFDVTYYHGSQYTPKPGDLFFYENFSHVGLVWYVEDEFFYCIEGNAKEHDYQIPEDPEVDSYYVMTNKRLTEDYYFGVPAYKGCDKDHTYVRGYDTSHPHKAYYQCRTCGDKYYTGYTECVAGCGRCFSCGCSTSYAGYYKVNIASGPVKLRTSHSIYADYLGYVPDGAVVYLHAANKSAGWAYIEYDGVRGHILLQYLSKYHDIPASPKVTTAQAEYLRHDDVTLNWNVPSNTELYRLKVFRNGTLCLEKVIDLTQTYTLEALAAGEYEVQVTALNLAGASTPGVVKFTVRDTCTVSYDTLGGADTPQPQTQKLGEGVSISTVEPVRQGYTFLGWTEDPLQNIARYHAGDTLYAHNDMTLYAVWKQNDALPHAIQIERMPDRTAFLKGETLDTTGMALRLTYSDGSGQILTDGYAAEGFDSESYGTKTVTVTCDTLRVTYEVQVVPYLPGDVDLNKAVNRDDVMHLLWHISFPEQFRVEVPVDLNGDAVVNRDDVLHLLWHISFPDQFPLTIQWPEDTDDTQNLPKEDV